MQKQDEMKFSGVKKKLHVFTHLNSLVKNKKILVSVQFVCYTFKRLLKKGEYCMCLLVKTLLLINTYFSYILAYSNIHCVPYLEF